MTEATGRGTPFGATFRVVPWTAAGTMAAYFAFKWIVTTHVARASDAGLDRLDLDAASIGEALEASRLVIREATLLVSGTFVVMAALLHAWCCTRICQRAGSLPPGRPPLLHAARRVPRLAMTWMATAGAAIALYWTVAVQSNAWWGYWWSQLAQLVVAVPLVWYVMRTALVTAVAIADDDLPLGFGWAVALVRSWKETAGSPFRTAGQMAFLALFPALLAQAPLVLVVGDLVIGTPVATVAAAMGATFLAWTTSWAVASTAVRVAW